jgi:CO/xanthine dehydrogenase Mo-binding subunit/aerobic-type carbon monoxide dehydrogenase small subunit (CoxS/CutS family)
MNQDITLKVNGRIHQVHVEPDTPLLYVLRNDLQLKGAKFACGLEQCGACRILIDGQAVPSCRISVRSVQGRDITTLEGLGREGDLHPLQEAFIEEQAIQCGFCVPGMIITAKALLDRNPHPTDAEIKTEMSDNLCRCGIYDRIVRAIKRAAGLEIDPPSYREGLIEASKLPPGSPFSIETDPESGSLAKTPDLDSWVRINTDETVTIFTGKVELGQDIRTSVAMIGAEELDISLDRIQVVMADTEQTPNEGYTVSSLSLETTGNAIRHAAAEARQIMLLTAADNMDADVDGLTTSDGTITDQVTGRTVTYWELFGGKKFDCRVTGIGRLKNPDDYRVVGRPVERLDLKAKVTGDACFVHDLELPDMVHGRVVRPPNYGARLISVDDAAVYQMPGVLQVVRDGSFLAVIAEREEQAVLAMEALRKTATWESDLTLPQQEKLLDHLLNQPHQAFLIVDGTPVDDPVPPIETPEGAAHTLSATYFRPYHMHASLGPSAAVAQMIEGKLTVWTHSQGVYPLRGSLAEVMGMPKEDIRAVHMEGPGCFGHNGADDVALDAALLARALPGRPVSLKWMRVDENTWEPYGPATVIQMQASLDREGAVMDWNHDVWGYTHMGRALPTGDTSGLLAAWHLAKPFKKPKPVLLKFYHMGSHRNADPLYAFPQRRIVKHFLPDSPLRTSALRGLGSYANVFAIESFIDELAHASNTDPLEFRLRNLKNERARDVIKAAAEKAGWQWEKKARDNNRGRGIAFAQYKNLQSYIAVVVDLKVNRLSGQISLLGATMAADAGQIVNPDAVSSQLEGIFIQSASWTLREQVAFDQHGIISVDWHSYPILRFRDSPGVQTVLVNRPDQPYLGIGEGGQGPIPAAIANAIFDAVGIRLRHIPFTPERVLEALNLK